MSTYNTPKKNIIKHTPKKCRLTRRALVKELIPWLVDKVLGVAWISGEEVL